MTELTITTRTTGSGHVLVLRGELDVSSAPALRQAGQALTYAAGQELVLDLSELTYCDSSGISAFIALRRHTDTCGAGFALASPSPSICRTLAVIGLSDFFTYHDAADHG
jgi:anti-anti-sigma factor